MSPFNLHAAREIVDTLKFVMPQRFSWAALRLFACRTSLFSYCSYQPVAAIYLLQPQEEMTAASTLHHMEMRGLAMKLVPRKICSFWEGVNQDALTKQLTTDLKTLLENTCVWLPPSKDYRTEQYTSTKTSGVLS